MNYEDTGGSLPDCLIVIYFDGYNVGFSSDLWNHFLEFDDREEAFDICLHWNNWMRGMDV